MTTGETTRRRARLVVRLCAATAAGTLTLILLLPAGVAGAEPITDSDPGAAAMVVERLAQVDAALRVSDAILPDAVAAADAAAAAVEVARAGESRALSARPATTPPIEDGAAGNDVADVAADAILDDLHPERATAARFAAEQLVVDTASRRDFLVTMIRAAREERGQLLVVLDATGQVRTRWSVSLLDALGAPVTWENIRALSAWIGAEANTGRAHNPLATTMGAAGAIDLNDHGVKGYPNDVVGIDATVRTLRNGSYDEILAALTAGDSAARVVNAVAASPWGTGENAVKRLSLDS